jgi:hypothetical protein
MRKTALIIAILSQRTNTLNLVSMQVQDYSGDQSINFEEGACAKRGGGPFKPFGVCSNGPFKRRGSVGEREKAQMHTSFMSEDIMR